MTTNDLELTTFVPQTAGDEAWAQFHEFTSVLQAERLPDDPLPAPEHTRRSWLSIPPIIKRETWLLRRPDGRAVGLGYVDLVQMEENRHAAQADIAIHPEFRRQGLGRRLLAEVTRATEADGRRLLLFVTLNTIPAGAAFMETIGAKRGLEATENQLAIAEVDQELMDNWRVRGAERAAGYELEFFTGPYPEALLPDMAAIKQAMNQAPVDDLEVNDFTFTPEMLGQIDAALVQRGLERWTLLAREKGSGAVAGYTEIVWQPHKPTIGSQGDTAVLEQHRNHGLGRWLKAEMLLRVLAEKPAVTHIRTNNANSNAPMLKINHEMGFRPYISTSVWQVGVSDVQRYLQRSAVS